MLKCGCQTQPDRNSKDVAWSAYTPAAGKLAAAMATISAKRRPMRDGAERSNEFNRCISPIPYALAENHCSALKARSAKMVPLPEHVEDAAKIATRTSSGG
jgi:hypothetical protein